MTNLTCFGGSNRNTAYGCHMQKHCVVDGLIPGQHCICSRVSRISAFPLWSITRQKGQVNPGGQLRRKSHQGAAWVPSSCEPRTSEFQNLELYTTPFTGLTCSIKTVSALLWPQRVERTLTLLPFIGEREANEQSHIDPVCTAICLAFAEQIGRAHV